jgi:hypothetical protein
MSEEAKESENQPIETAGKIQVLQSKKFPSGAQLTKVTVDGCIFYIREAAIAVNKFQSEQVLEILCPDHMWDRCCDVVRLEDTLQRRIMKPELMPEFTILWAETELNAPPG